MNEVFCFLVAFGFVCFQIFDLHQASMWSLHRWNTSWLCSGRLKKKGTFWNCGAAIPTLLSPLSSSRITGIPLCFCNFWAHLVDLCREIQSALTGKVRRNSHQTTLRFRIIKWVTWTARQNARHLAGEIPAHQVWGWWILQLTGVSPLFCLKNWPNLRRMWLGTLVQLPSSNHMLLQDRRGKDAGWKKRYRGSFFFRRL